MSSQKSNKYIAVLIVLFIFIGAGFYWYNKKEAKAPGENMRTNTQPAHEAATSTAGPAPATSPQTQTNVKGSTSPDYTPSQYSAGGESAGADIAVQEVDYNGKAFTPGDITIHPNDYIFFRNKSTAGFWPMVIGGSGYPDFNAGLSIAPGKEFKFQFTKIGTWKYEDKLNPPATGIIRVQN